MVLSVPGAAPVALIQEALFHRLAGAMFWWARDRYMAAVRLLDVETSLSAALGREPFFHHEMVRAPYLVIASHFRTVHEDGRQLRLPFNGTSTDEYLAQDWVAYFVLQVRRLVRHDDEYTRLVLKSVAEYGSSEGELALNALVALLSDRYRSTCSCLWPYHWESDPDVSSFVGRVIGAIDRTGP